MSISIILGHKENLIFITQKQSLITSLIRSCQCRSRMVTIYVIWLIIGIK